MNRKWLAPSDYAINLYDCLSVGERSQSPRRTIVQACTAFVKGLRR